MSKSNSSENKMGRSLLWGIMNFSGYGGVEPIPEPKLMDDPNYRSTGRRPPKRSQKQIRKRAKWGGRQPRGGS